MKPRIFDSSMVIRPQPSGVLVDPPNKAPEPTPTSVTPRAFSRVTEMKRWIADRNPARGAPDAVVAHL
jgi:hypothetical protein